MYPEAGPWMEYAAFYEQLVIVLFRHHLRRPLHPRLPRRLRSPFLSGLGLGLGLSADVFVMSFPTSKRFTSPLDVIRPSARFIEMKGLQMTSFLLDEAGNDVDAAGGEEDDAERAEKRTM